MRVHAVASLERAVTAPSLRARDVVLDGARIVHHDRIAAQSLAVHGGHVAGVAAPDAVRVDLRDHLVFPGLINAHDHLQLNNIPGLRHAEPFPNSYAWIDAFEAHRGRDEVEAAVAVPRAVRHWHGALKNVLAGVTTVAHHDPWYATLDEAEFPVGLLRDFGWSHSLGLGLPRGDLPPRYGPPVVESFVKTNVDWPWIIHLAEGVDAVAQSELDQLDALGCLGSNTVLVHGVGLTTSDVARVVERNAAVVWCPASNLSLFGATLSPRALFSAGRLALGSDSRLTGSCDLLDEAAVAAARSDLSPRELTRMMTADAAAILRLGGRGVLDIGSRADCVIVASNGDPYEALLNTTRSSIRVVVRAGRPVIADPDFATWFHECGVAAVPARLDGCPKLVAATIALPEAVRLEPGLEIM
jgi:cytosine/adenosine deaminase-related metal-dependent hydrolase